MKTLVIDNTETGDSEFEQQLFRYLDKHLTDYETIPSKHLTDSTAIHQRFNGVIITGVPKYYSLDSVYERAQHLEWLRDTNLPVLGICLGHQIMGFLHGSQIIEKGEGEDGLRMIEATQPDIIFDGLGKTFEAQALHTASITLPGSFIRLAKSDRCQVEIMKHRAKPMYGVQFHPEFSSDTQKILENFLKVTNKNKHR